MIGVYFIIYHEQLSDTLELISMRKLRMGPLGSLRLGWSLERPSDWKPPTSYLHLVVVQLLSRVWLFATPWTAARQASLSFTLSWSLLKRISIESVMTSNHLILNCPLLLPPSFFPSIRIFSNVSSSHQVAKVLELQLQHQSFQ